VIKGKREEREGGGSGKPDAKPQITELVAPPVKAEPTAVSSKSVARGDEGFFDALQTYLTKYYNLRLG
jgi:hypothetical protein